MKSKDWRTAWVTGASSGIGRELALALAARGIAVAASARRTDELAELARGNPKISPFPLDVTDRAAVARTVAEIETRLGPIDVAILNAGVGQRMGARNFDPDIAAQTMAINYQGLVHGLAALMPRMLERKRGQIALMSSLAGYRGLPGAVAYCPTKAAAISLAESLEPELDAAGVSISVVNPGFVATPMTAKFRRPPPFMITPQAAARKIIAGLDRDKFEIAFPWQMVWLGKLGRLLPYRAYLWAMARNIDSDVP